MNIKNEIEYFDDKTKEFWEKNREYSVKIGNIQISSENEQELRDFIDKLEANIHL